MSTADLSLTVVCAECGRPKIYQPVHTLCPRCREVADAARHAMHRRWARIGVLRQVASMRRYVRTLIPEFPFAAPCAWAVCADAASLVEVLKGGGR